MKMAVNLEGSDDDLRKLLIQQNVVPAAELEKAQKEIDLLDRKLSNPSFLERAPAEVVLENQSRREEYLAQANKLKSGIDRLP